MPFVLTSDAVLTARKGNCQGVAQRALSTGSKIIEAAAHLMNPPHRLAVGPEQQDGAL